MLYLIFFVGVIASGTPSSNSSTTSTAPHFVIERTDSLSSGKKESVAQESPGESAYKAGYHLRWTENKLQEAFQQFMSAASEGHKGALWAVATMATHGIGCQPDIQLAIDSYAVLGDDPQALNNLGALYESFNPEKKDEKTVLEQAKELYRQAKEKSLEIGRINFERVEAKLLKLGRA